MVLFPLISKAQQTPQYTMNMFDKYRFNPAYAGMDASLSINGSLKNQWETFPGQPKFQQINAHMPFYLVNGGVGLKFFNDATGAENTLGLSASFNYVYESSLGLFSFGLGVGVVQKKLDGSLLRAPDGIYEGNTIVHNDPILSNTKGSGIGPNLGVGIYFASEYLEAGIALDQGFGNTITLNNAEETSFTLNRIINFFTEYTYPIDEEFTFYPSVFVKSDFTQTQLDVSGRLDYQDLYFGGLSFRGYSAKTVDALAIFLGARINANLRVAYAYDITLSGLRNFAEGTHELVVNYNLNKPLGIGRPVKVIYNPRY